LAKTKEQDKEKSGIILRLEGELAEAKKQEKEKSGIIIRLDGELEKTKKELAIALNNVEKNYGKKKEE
jgi:hypothetical protein